MLPVLEGLEAERKKLTKPVYLFILAVIAILVIRIAIGVTSDEPAVEITPADDHNGAIGPQESTSNSSGGGFFDVILLGGGIGALGYFFWFVPRRNALKSRYKREAIGSLVKFIGPDLEYQPQQGISRDEYVQSGIFLTGGDVYTCEDLVSGKMGSTAIRFSEVHAQAKQTTQEDGKTQTTYETLFRGIFFSADFNKHFNGRTVVLTDQAERFMGGLGTMFQKMNVVRDPLIKMDSVDFEKAFAVYGTDPVEANYILSPSLMERILAFKQRSGNIQMSFVNSNVYISIPIKENLFEPKILTSMIDAKSSERYFDYLQMVTGIVEELNLNTRIWTKI
jgi:hypothetical protein